MILLASRESNNLERGSNPKGTLDPQLAVQRAILDSLGNIIAGEFFRASQIGDCARDLQHAIVTAGAELHVGHGELQKLEGRFVDGAERLNFATAHTGVAINSGLMLETFVLALSRGDDPLADLRGSFAISFAGDFTKGDCGHLDVQINPVQQWTGNAAQIILDFARRAAGFGGHLAVGRAWHCHFVNAVCASQERSICPRIIVEYQFRKRQRPSEAISEDAGFN